MKVLFVSGMFSTKYGGFEKFTIELLEQGVDLSIIYNAKPDSLEYLDDLEKYHVEVSTVCGNILQRTWQTYKIIRRKRPDIVHYHFGFIAYFLFLILKLFHPKIKQILTLHCEYSRNGLFWNTLTRLCYRSLDCVTCVSDGVRQGLVKNIGDSNHYIVHYLGVSKRKIKNHQLRNELGIGPGELVITSIGFDIEVKGFDLLAKAVSELRVKQGIPQFKVVIIGLGKQENCKFQEILHRYGVEDCILSVATEVAYCEDFHLMACLCYFAKKVVHLGIPYYNYRQQEGSVMHKLNKKTEQDERWVYQDIIQFFHEHGVYDVFRKTMCWRVLKATQELVLDKSTWKEFCTITPEKKEFIWSCPYINNKLKLNMWCLTHHMHWLSRLMLGLRALRHG